MFTINHTNLTLGVQRGSIPSNKHIWKLEKNATCVTLASVKTNLLTIFVNIRHAGNCLRPHTVT